MIEIIDTKTVNLGTISARHADIIISSGSEAYLFGVGGLPLTGDLQAILNAREAELWTVAQTSGKAVDLYEVTPKKAIKALALVMLDEINALRQAAVPPLAARTIQQLEAAVKAKLKNL